MREVLCIITGGSGDGRRARRLFQDLHSVEVTYYEVDKSRPRSVGSKEIWRLLSAREWDLVIQEGTGIAGGFNLIRAAKTRGQRYVVSSGDPIGGFFRTVKGPLWGAAFEQYEKALYRNSAGFIGWTPYLTGMAIRMGAPRGVTVEGGADLDVFRRFSDEERLAARRHFGLQQDHLVCGVVGSLQWVPRQSYSYGLELIETLKHVRRPDVSMLVVGDGDGRAELERRVPDNLRHRVIFTGRLEQLDVVRSLNAMDVGFITQAGELGIYRLTTKLPEYLGAGLPVAMSPIPGFYDYALPAGWSLPDHHPASEQFHKQCAAWLDGLEESEVLSKAAHARAIAAERFNYDMLGARFAAFVESVL